MSYSAVIGVILCRIIKRLFRATEQAINTLIEAQRECEEMYISEPEIELRVISLLDRTEDEKE